MKTETSQRSKWEIDGQLARLIGQDVRVGAKAFRPLTHNGDASPRWISVRDLVLPDGSDTDGTPVFFEGRLRQFLRQVAVVYVTLDASEHSDSSANGRVFFRGQSAAVLPGPAIVELAFPFVVERLPAGDRNYWQDLRTPRAQFDFPFLEDNEQDPARQNRLSARELASARKQPRRKPTKG